MESPQWKPLLILESTAAFCFLSTNFRIVFIAKSCGMSGLSDKALDLPRQLQLDGAIGFERLNFQPQMGASPQPRLVFYETAERGVDA